MFAAFFRTFIQIIITQEILRVRPRYLVLTLTLFPSIYTENFVSIHLLLAELLVIEKCTRFFWPTLYVLDA